MGRRLGPVHGAPPEPDDLIFPREDGKQRLVSGTYKHFQFDLEALGFPIQRQYESRSTFRNLALSAGRRGAPPSPFCPR